MTRSQSVSQFERRFSECDTTRKLGTRKAEAARAGAANVTASVPLTHHDQFVPAGPKFSFIVSVLTAFTRLLLRWTPPPSSARVSLSPVAHRLMGVIDVGVVENLDHILADLGDERQMASAMKIANRTKVAL